MPEHTFETRERNVDFCPEYRQAGERLRTAIAQAGRKTKARVAVPLPPPPVDTGLLCRKCPRRASGPRCYTCLAWHLPLDVEDGFRPELDRLPQPSPDGPKCGKCDRPRNPFCDRSLNKILAEVDWPGWPFYRPDRHPTAQDRPNGGRERIGI